MNTRLTKSAEGSITLELNDEAVEAYVKAYIREQVDTRIVRWLPPYQSVHGIFHAVLKQHLLEHPEAIREPVTAAVRAWLDARDGWLARMAQRDRKSVV
jgi:hypothetical protein